MGVQGALVALKKIGMIADIKTHHWIRRINISYATFL